MRLGWDRHVSREPGIQGHSAITLLAGLHSLDGEEKRRIDGYALPEVQSYES